MKERLEWAIRKNWLMGALAALTCLLWGYNWLAIAVGAFAVFWNLVLWVILRDMEKRNSG